MKYSPATILLLLAILTTHPACSDVYRYYGRDGTACFTDSPTSKDAVLIMKDQAQRRAGSEPEKKRSKRRGRHHAESVSVLSGNVPVTGKLTSKVGFRHDPIDGTVRYHNGVDIAVPEGTPVQPVAPGRVIYSGNRSGYGNIVVVAHDDGMSTAYAHNRSNMVIAGERVERDSVLAYSGSTGRSTGPHLHFEAWQGGTNVTASFLKSWGAIRNTDEVIPHTIKIRTALLPDGSILFTNLPYSYR